MRIFSLTEAKAERKALRRKVVLWSQEGARRDRSARNGPNKYHSTQKQMAQEARREVKHWSEQLRKIDDMIAAVAA